MAKAPAVPRAIRGHELAAAVAASEVQYVMLEACKADISRRSQ